MTRRLFAGRIWAGLLLGLLAWPASGSAADDDARGAPPQLLKFERYDAAAQTVHLLQTREVLIPTLFKEVTPDGRTVDKVAVSTEHVETAQALNTKELRAFSMKGEPLKVAETLAKLKKGDPVLTVSAGKLVPKAFRPLFKDDVVVLELPQPVAPMPEPAPK